jgi:hypothetical protein
MPASLYVDAATIAGGIDAHAYFSYHDVAPPTSDMSYSDVIFGDVLLSHGHCYREARSKKGWR